jgi:predicted flavoprotein YhiN
MKTRQITYTTEKLNRNFSKPTFESMAKIVWQRITNSMAVDVFRFAIDKFNNNSFVQQFFTNGRKYQLREDKKLFCDEFNKHRQANRIANHFANPKQERDMQMWLNELKFGKL